MKIIENVRMDKKHEPTVCWIQETHFKYDIGRLNVKWSHKENENEVYTMGENICKSDLKSDIFKYIKNSYNSIIKK